MKVKCYSVLLFILTSLVLSTAILFGAISGTALASRAAQPDAPQNTVQVQRIASGLARPVDLTAPPGDRSRLFVLEKTGYIRIISVVNGVYTLLPTPFLAINTLVSGGPEQGLLGLAFHPNFAANGYFYINYTDVNGDTVSQRADRVDCRSTLRQPQWWAASVWPRRLSIHRPWRRRQRGGSPGPGAEPRHHAGQDAACRRGRRVTLCDPCEQPLCRSRQSAG